MYRKTVTYCNFLILISSQFETLLNFKRNIHDIKLNLTIKRYYLNWDEHLLTAFLKAISLVITSPARLRVKNDMVQSSHVSIKRFYKRADIEKEFTASINMHKYTSPRHTESSRELKPKNVKREDGLCNPITCQRFYLYSFSNKSILPFISNHLI